MSTLEQTRETATGAADGAPITIEEASAFIWREAEMLDRQEYADWLKLWTEQGIYVIPIDREEGDYASELNIAYDDAAMREMRVKRLKSGFAMSSAPSARTVRTTSRFVIDGTDGDATVVRCAQVLVEFKFERTRVVGADMIYRLVRRDGGLALDGKVVRLLNSDDPLWGIGYLF